MKKYHTHLRIADRTMIQTQLSIRGKPWYNYA